MKLIERTLIGIMILYPVFIAVVLLAPDKKQKLLNPIVRLNQGNQTFCTGTVVNSTTIITASHCVVEANMFGMMMVRGDIEIRPESNLPIGVNARVGYVTTQLDTDILKGDFSKFEPKKHISDINELMKLQTPGRKLLSCGYPLGGNLQCTPTIYLRRDIFMQDVEGLLLPGMSGGPTMLEDGTQIAVNVAVYEDHSIVAPIFNVDFNMGDE